MIYPTPRIKKPVSKFNTGTIMITVDTGYDEHSIEFSGRTFDRISSGKHLIIKGQGFHMDEDGIYQDYWEFNRDSRGSLYVYTDDAFQIYDGDMDGDVWINDSRIEA